jgi:hypothetical protein
MSFADNASIQVDLGQLLVVVAVIMPARQDRHPSGRPAYRVGSNRVTLRRNEASRYSRLMTSAISSAVANRS